MPEDGYAGDYVLPIAEAVRGEWSVTATPARRRPLARRPSSCSPGRGEELVLVAIVRDLDRLGPLRPVRLPAEPPRGRRVEEGIAALEAAGDAYRAEGAIWFRASRYGDEKDRVLVRGDGETTYLAADVAYHLEKASRGHERLIDVLGADHHGYIDRLRAVLAAGGRDLESLEVMLVQLVSLVERGEARRMSKRAGTLVTLADLLDIGNDAARSFPCSATTRRRSTSTSTSRASRARENPVYYVQYAHARVCSILALRAGERPAPPEPHPAPAELDPAERALVRLAARPAAVAEAEQRRAPHRVAAYLIELRARPPRLLPPLPRGGRSLRGRGVQAGRLPGHHRSDRPSGARPARRGGAPAHVAPRGPGPERPART